jgi:hypothetical protein
LPRTPATTEKQTAVDVDFRMKTQESKVMSEMTDDAKIIETIVRAHYDTCDYTRNKMEPFLQKAKLNPQYVSCTGAVSCPSRNFSISRRPVAGFEPLTLGF